MEMIYSGNTERIPVKTCVLLPLTVCAHPLNGFPSAEELHQDTTSATAGHQDTYILCP